MKRLFVSNMSNGEHLPANAVQAHRVEDLDRAILNLQHSITICESPTVNMQHMATHLRAYVAQLLAQRGAVAEQQFGQYGGAAPAPQYQPAHVEEPYVPPTMHY